MYLMKGALRMQKIPSFQVNHLFLEKGLYVSRKDKVKDEVITTFDIRMTKPNKERVMNTAGIHAIEHIGATFLRNDKIWKEKVIYFGPMGCRTGFYLILVGDLAPLDIAPLVKEMFDYIANFSGDIPGNSPKDCGNYLDLNLAKAKSYAKHYLDEVLNNLTKNNTEY